MAENYLNIDRVLHMIKNQQMTAEEGYKWIRKIQNQNNNEALNKMNLPKEYFQPFWEEKEILHPSQSESKYVLVFCKDVSSKNLFSDLGINATVVVPGKEFKVDGDIYEIDPGSQADYIQLIISLKQRNLVPSRIIHSWSNEVFSSNLNKLQDQIKEGLYSMFFLSRALMELYAGYYIKLLYVYEDKGEFQPQYAGMSGFIRTIRKENVHFKWKTIQLDRLRKNWVATLVHELESEDDELEISYQGGQRLVRRMRVLNHIGINQNLLRSKGTYIITGGFGGVGYTFAKYLANETKANLVITGRSKFDSSHKEKVEELQTLGSEVLYIQADVSIRAEVKKVLKQARKQFTEIHAVIHAAGIVRDSFVSKKLTEQIEEVIAPKLYGTVWLDVETRKDNLDFFMMFSSIMSVIGNAGQCDYTYANAFMDNYAFRRDLLREKEQRNGKTISINWPLWEEGGMKVDEPTLVFMENTLGILPISNTQGIQAFIDALHSPAKQFVMVRESGKNNKAIFNYHQEQKAIEPVEHPPLQISDTAFYSYICRDVKKIVSEILYVNEHKIDIDVDISEFGFDSISTTDFINRINKKFHLELTPPIFYEHPNIDSFVVFLKDTYKDRLTVLYSEEKNSEEKNEVEKSEVTLDKKPSMKVYVHENTNSTKNNESGAETDLVAIIGVSGVFPHSDNLDELWMNLYSERNLITEIPLDRWSWREYYGDPIKQINKTNVKWGGFMNEIDKFDALFFGISRREAELMDPRQRIFLETAWKVIEDAGYKPSDLSGTKTGLFVGIGNSDYYDLLSQHHVEPQAHTPTGLFNSILTNRISYLLNLHGPSEPIDTACSSSLVAVHRAVETIRSGECTLAIAGGINVLASPNLYIALNKAGMLSADGSCKTFDKKANGYVRGEGSAALLLKSLSKAREDGDHIYAVIRGTAVNHGGHVNSITTPNPNAQSDLIVDAWTKSAIDPATVSYIETHGSGTPLGDPIEINALKQAFSRLYRDWGKSSVEPALCGIGTIKTNIGHLESAAGIAGIIKVLLCMKHEKLLKNLHFEELNPYIDLKDSPFYIVDETREWKRLKEGTLRRAGVSSFGFGGVNAHVVLEEYPNNSDHGATDEKPYLFVFSAKNERSLDKYVEEFVRFIESTDVKMEDMAYTLQLGRNSMDERLAVVADRMQCLNEKLLRYLQHDSSIEDLYRESSKRNHSTLGFLIEGEEGKTFIEHLLKKKKLSKLAHLWVGGMEIEWESLYDEKPSRVSLPTYSFARESYWIPSEADPNHSLFSPIHPLLHKNISNLDGLKFSSRFTGKEFFLADYKVNGSKCIPGIVFLEMARTAMEKVSGISLEDQDKIKLKNVVWAKEINIHEMPKEVYLEIVSDDDGDIGYEIHGEFIHGDEIIVFSQGSAVLTKYSDIVKTDLSSLQMDCNQKIVTAGDCYEVLERAGFIFGEGQKGVESLYIGSEWILAKLQLPSFLSEEKNPFVLHPSLLEAAVQASYIFILNSLHEGRNFAEVIAEPSAIQELEVFNSCTKSMWAQIKYSESYRVGDTTLKLDVDMYDQQGKVCVRMKGLTF